MPEPWALRGSLSFAGTILHEKHVESCPDIGPICATEATEAKRPYQHDQRLYAFDLAGDVELGLVPNLALEVTFVLRDVVERISFLDLNDAPYTPPVPDYHHRNETLVGPADPWVMLHAGGSAGRLLLGARAGVTIPLGSTVPNPFPLGEMGQPHEHIQFGTGTIDPVIGLSAEYELGPLAAFLWTLDRLTVSTNSFGYRAGNRYFGGLGAQSRLGLEDWRFGVAIDLYREDAETWNGTRYREGNIGRTDLLADLTMSWMFASDLALNLGAKVPFLTRSEAIQISYPAILSIGLAFGSSPGRR